MRDRGAISTLLAVVLGAGAAVGAVLNIAGVVELTGGATDSIAAPATASYYDCPDGAALGVLGQGDRVFLTGRDDSGTWVEVRSPVSSETRVWMRARQVVPDGDTSGLTFRDCVVPVGVIAGEETTTTTSTTTTTIAPTTTTAAPPSVNASSEHSEIRSHHGLGQCFVPPGTYQYATLITAQVSAAAGVSSVTMQWSSTVYNRGPVAMNPSDGNTYTDTLGPYQIPEQTQFAGDQSTPITVVVRVTDALGRTASSQVVVTLNGCEQ